MMSAAAAAAPASGQVQGDPGDLCGAARIHERPDQGPHLEAAAHLIEEDSDEEQLPLPVRACVHEPLFCKPIRAQKLC